MKNHSFCTKENIQVKYFGICTALLSEEKTFPSVENVLRRRALGRIKHLEQGVFYGVWGGGGGGAGGNVEASIWIVGRGGGEL